jgi:hypothetical protein
MIVASFDKTQNRTAAVSGAYQYDTGQRLAMHGLPSPSEMAGRDDLLSGDLVTVQAQFSYKGDSQADMRLAVWDEARQLWLCDVPDEYLTRHRDVHVYVYCYYGADKIGERGETAYEATFRPISRPAPSGTVTEEQLRQWANLKDEIEISFSKVDSAIANANEAAEAVEAAGERAVQAEKDAEAAAKSAKDAMDELQDAGGDVGNAESSTTMLPGGSEATASLDLTGNVGRLDIGSPRGNDGPKGETGETGPSDIKVEFDADTGTLTITTITTEGEE